MSFSGNLEEMVEMMKRKSPELLDLLTASTDADFDSSLEVLLVKAIDYLEKNSANFANLGEVGLTAVLVGTLRVPGLDITQESHSNGHVDITISAVYSAYPRTRLGEAKLYQGYKYHKKGWINS